MTAPTMNAPLPACVTIDKFTPDAYLDNARFGTPGAGANTDTSSAISNLVGCVKGKTPSKFASIVGHGDMGIIATGGGKVPSGPSQYIAVSNESTWTGPLAALKGQITDLYLYGCQVGAGNDGAQLLFDMAKIVNATVWGPASTIYCDSKGNFTLDPKGVWQSATPAAKPNPIEPPVLGGVEDMSDEAHIYVQGNKLVLPIESRSDATYAPQGPTAAVTPSADIAGALADEVQWSAPFTPPGEPSGLITGRLKVTFGRGDRPVRKSFLVYSHTLLADEDEKGIYYRLSTNFRKIATGK
jgi:hypothetical protein